MQKMKTIILYTTEVGVGVFHCKNTLCVAGCCHDIATNSRRQNRREFALCVSRQLHDVLNIP